MRTLIKIELHKFLRPLNLFFSAFALFFYGLMCYANVNVAMLESRITRIHTEFDATTEEFIRNCLVIVPVWSIISNGIDFRNYAIQKNFADGLNKGQYLKSKFVSNALIGIIAILIYLVVLVFIASELKFSTTPPRLAIAIVQITFIVIGYILISFALLSLLRSTTLTLLVFFGVILLELVISYSLVTRNVWRGQIVGPFSAVRAIGFDSSKKYISLTDVPYTSWLTYSCVGILFLVLGSFFIRSKEFKPI